MAYGKKYTTGTITRGAINYELEVWMRDYSGTTLIMDNLQRLGLEIQGSSEQIETAIVKTSLHFTLANQHDATPPSGHKCGNWEEFYTPDALLYKVVLKVGLLNYWSGFITPDSWQDTLSYRDSVTITARDMIGHMQDFAVDTENTFFTPLVMDGMISLQNLIIHATGLAGVAMTLDTASAQNDFPALVSGTYKPMSWMLDVQSLSKESNWYETIEDIMSSLGLVLRFVGNDTIKVMPLRALCKCGMTSQTQKQINFVNSSGSRYLEPALKMITEKLDITATPDTVMEFGQRSNLSSFIIDRGDFQLYNGSGYTHPASIVTAASEWVQTNATKEILRPTTSTQLINGEISGKTGVIVSGVHKNNISSVNYIDSTAYVRTRKRFSPNTRLNVSFVLGHCYNWNGEEDMGRTHSYTGYVSPLPKGTFRYSLMWRKADGTYLTLSEGAWKNESLITAVDIVTETVTRGGQEIEVTSEQQTVSLEFTTPNVAGEIEFRIYNFLHNESAYSTAVVGLRLSDLTFAVDSANIPKSFTVNTTYDEAQNTTLKRTVKYGFIPEKYAVAGTIASGFYRPDAANGYTSINNVNWSNSPDLVLPLPVFVHLQIISLYAKANSILSGVLRDYSGSPGGITAKWTYGNRNFFLHAGTWNLLTGRIESAILREYDTYEDVVGQISTVNYTGKLTGGNASAVSQSNFNSSGISGGTGASSGGGGGTFTLNPATASTLGGVKIGSGIDVQSDGTISVEGGVAKPTLFVRITHSGGVWSVDETEMTAQEMAAALGDGTYEYARLVVDTADGDMNYPASLLFPSAGVAEVSATIYQVTGSGVSETRYHVELDMQSGGTVTLTSSRTATTSIIVPIADGEQTGTYVVDATQSEVSDIISSILANPTATVLLRYPFAHSETRFYYFPCYECLESSLLVTLKAKWMLNNRLMTVNLSPSDSTAERSAEIPKADSSTLGLVRVGEGLNIDYFGILSVAHLVYSFDTDTPGVEPQLSQSSFSIKVRGLAPAPITYMVKNGKRLPAQVTLSGDNVEISAVEYTDNGGTGLSWVFHKIIWAEDETMTYTSKSGTI